MPQGVQKLAQQGWQQETHPDGRIVLPPAGRVLLLDGDSGAADHKAEASQTAVFLALLLALPMFGQSFHYMIDLPPLYFLSKAWPILTAPLALYALVRLSLPLLVLYGVLVAYVLGLTPLLSMIYFGTGLVDALATTAKTLPFLYYFSALGLLLLLRPRPETVVRAVLWLGAATFIAMALLWVVIPADFYKADPAQSKLFLLEAERGYRIFMPMFFGTIFIFYLTRRVFARQELATILVLLVCFALMVMIYKQRTVILAVLLTVGLIALAASSGWRRGLLLLFGTAGGLLAAGLIYAHFLERIEDALGASLTIRQLSITIATDYVLSNPLVMWFGAGSVTRLSDNNLQTILGNAHFYLADIGWLGIVFEYGLIGASLILAVYLASLRRIRRIQEATHYSMITAALGDHIVLMLITSLVYSLVFTPGEMATALALATYLGLHSDTSVPRP
ncbi:O-antigen ligase family protein [Oceanibaculum indicum]|uniref:O-antigen ligase-like membrane protein n=1 Tax=Oceanibaculum indicum TaxID=526216 RepID=A0A420WAV7_9PROT|nr:hypothetical protein [Oceanibaculum indicum]RKQ68105.1 hypothetical protein BCL74_3424 [Oceanibaculum indicum]